MGRQHDKLPLPFIKCIFCSYQDKVVIDLEHHLADHDRQQLYRMFGYGDVEFCLYEAIRIAEQQSGIKS